MSSKWVECARCKEPICLSDEQERMLRQNQNKFYCLWGHDQYFPSGPTDTDIIRRERDRLKQDNTYLVQEAQRAQQAKEFAERRAAAARGQVTKLKKRAANGVCPCCNRTFVDLQRHMATKHAGFLAEDAQQAHGTVQ